jgi:hypothetical protein
MAKQDTQSRQKNKKQGDEGGNRYALFGAAGVGLLAVAGAGYVLYREKNVEKPRHRVVEQDGFFEVREYPELLVAEATVAGRPLRRARQGLRPLADYIFAKSRDGEKVAMTAPVLSPAPAARIGSRASSCPPISPARRCPRRTPTSASPPCRRARCGVRFAGTADEATIADHEEQLRHWVGAKKLKTTGEPERAFYNSPFIPGPLRRTEVLIPVA